MSTAEAPARERLLTIGSVCRRLKPEFPDVSISKIRYLEDRGLLTPKRTQGGYRLFAEDDVERLETILRLQRDEFLPLRVIRDELAAGASEKRRRKRSGGLGDREEALDLDELCDRAGIQPARARELEEFGLLEPRVEAGQRRYSETDVDVAAACETLALYGIAPRHLRAFRTAADREAGLLEALVAPALRSRNPERRHAGIEDLQAMAEAAHELSQLLFTRNVRRLAGQ
ncbi:MAG TPA: MerR family transcriptional regulator [Gaiellaceae bacterium]|jgi:DNA-binding transcriptional MerR regulator|nr:MerR family transcriptional regulator [Gaiellaceae bacterium]